MSKCDLMLGGDALGYYSWSCVLEEGHKGRHQDQDGKLYRVGLWFWNIWIAAPFVLAAVLLILAIAGVNWWGP